MNMNGLRKQVGNAGFNGVRLALRLCLPMADENRVAVGFLVLGETTREALLSWRGC